MATGLHYDRDRKALRALLQRLGECGVRNDLMVYSDLVSGIPFQLPNVNGGRPFELGVPDWSELHRAILGEALLAVCVESYEAGEFLISALAVSAEDRQPSDGFRDLLHRLELTSSRRDPRWVDIWVDQVNRAYSFCAENPHWEARESSEGG